MKDIVLLIAFVWAVGATIGWLKSEERWMDGQVPVSEVRVLAEQARAAGLWSIQESMFRGYRICERQIAGATYSERDRWKRVHFGDAAILEQPAPADFNRVLRHSRPDPAPPDASAQP